MGGNQSIPKITKQDRAILEFVSRAICFHGLTIEINPFRSLKLQRDKVKQYQKKVCRSGPCTLYRVSLHFPAFQIQAVLDREHEIAKQHLAAGQKDRAIFTLRKRKYQESILAKTDGQLENLEKLVRVSLSYSYAVIFAYRAISLF